MTRATLPLAALSALAGLTLYWFSTVDFDSEDGIPGMLADS